MSASPTSSMAAGAVTVIVTVLDDPRLERTLDSLLTQHRLPEEVLIADGGDSPAIAAISERFTRRDPRVRRIAAPGTIAETRNGALAAVRTDLVAFLDTDEVAPPQWLEHLLAPFEEPAVGFAGGPTPANPASLHNVAARYYNAYMRRFYDRVVPERPHAIPMGNSAWRMRIFRELGALDLSVSGFGSEDQEIALRALHAGWRGVYVPGAAVEHDLSDIGWSSLFRKQRRYGHGGYLIWRRTGATYEASPEGVLPYLGLPLLVLAGLVMVVFPVVRWAGVVVALLGLAGLVVLVVVLTVEGRREDLQYPGYRFRAVEIWRRWATLLGALEAALSRSGPVASSSAPARR